MHLSNVISVLAVLSATIAAPSPRRHQIETRTHSQPEARQPFNPYHSEHRFAQMAENKKRASNHGRDAMPAVVVAEKKAKRQIKKRGGKCAARSASASVTSTLASVASASASVASASEYYVASSTNVTSSAWVEPSHSASPAAASATLNVQQAAVSSAEPSVASSSSHSSATPASTVGPSTTVEATSSAPATTSAASGSGDWKTGGHATYYYQNGNAGACGWYKSDSDNIIAINGNGYWQNYSQASDLCGKWVDIVNEKTGATVSAMVADVCPSCTGSTNSIDLSVGAFQAIADLSQGQVDIKWKFQ